MSYHFSSHLMRRQIYRSVLCRGTTFTRDKRRVPSAVKCIEYETDDGQTRFLAWSTIRACRQLSHRTTQTSRTPARNVLASLSKRVAIAL